LDLVFFFAILMLCFTQRTYTEEEVQIIDIISYKECSSLPSDTLAYFTVEHKKGVNFGMFAYIPHILSLGNINVKGVNKINWSVAPVKT